MGDTGKGQSAKICMNLQIAMIYEGFAEGMTLARKLGVEPQKMVELIQASMIRSGVVDYKIPFVLRHDYSPNFPLRLMHKDIHLLLDTAKEVRVKLPALETVDEIYELSSEEGWDDLDYAATIQLLEKWAGWASKGLPPRASARSLSNLIANCWFASPLAAIDHVTRFGLPGSMSFFSKLTLMRRRSSRLTA